MQSNQSYQSGDNPFSELAVGGLIGAGVGAGIGTYTGKTTTVTPSALKYKEWDKVLVPWNNGLNETMNRYNKVADYFEGLFKEYNVEFDRSKHDSTFQDGLTNIFNRKLGNSQFALDDFVQTANADHTNRIRGSTAKMKSDLRKGVSGGDSKKIEELIEKMNRIEYDNSNIYNNFPTISEFKKEKERLSTSKTNYNLKKIAKFAAAGLATGALAGLTIYGLQD